MAFRLRVGECWARRIAEIEEREKEEEADITPGPSTKRRKVVQHPFPNPERKRLCICPSLCSLLKAIAAGSEVANPAQELNVSHVMSSCVLLETEIASCSIIKISFVKFLF